MIPLTFIACIAYASAIAFVAHFFYTKGERKDAFPILLCVTFLSCYLFCRFMFNLGVEVGREEGRGLPITRNDVSYEGMTFKPSAVVKVGQSVQFVNADGRLYSLDEVWFEEGLSETNMTDRRLIVYKKGERLFIGSAEPKLYNSSKVHIIPTQTERYQTNK